MKKYIGIGRGSTMVLRLDPEDVRIEAGTDNRLAVRLSGVTRNQVGEVLTFCFPGGELELRTWPDGEEAFRIEAVARSRVKLSRIGLRFHYLPTADAATWRGCRERFHWLPNIKRQENQFTGDHNFRSPAVILTAAEAPAVSFVPDLDRLATDRPAPQYLDMGFPDDASPWIEWGFASQRPVYHGHHEPAGELLEIPETGTRMAADILLGFGTAILSETSRFLWNRYGQRLAVDPRPQVMPFEKYAEYGYRPALEHLWRPGPEAGTGGITLTTFHTPDGACGGREYADDLWFQCWFNNARTACGLAAWGEELGRPEYKARAREIINLTLAAPREKGMFPAIYAPHDGGWKGSSKNHGGGPDLYHLPDAAWTAIWIRKYHQEIEPVPDAPERLAELTDFLLGAQDAVGGFPTWIERGTLKPDPRLNGSASGAMALWFLGEEALVGAVSSDRLPGVLETIARGVEHLRQCVLPRLKFDDFELYYSCSAKPLDFFDPWTHLPGINTLAIQWCAEAFRVAHLLGVDCSCAKAGEALSQAAQTNLNAGRFCVDLLTLFQQVWNPPYLSLYAFGGFGVMNTDGEWHDARQAQFAETLANWHAVTGVDEYRERAVAAARAAFALMACDENREICPKNYRGTERNFEVRGMMAENYGHDGRDERAFQSGFHWGTGSALTTASRLWCNTISDGGSIP
jgi:hypothetical protein